MFLCLHYGSFLFATSELNGCDRDQWLVSLKYLLSCSLRSLWTKKKKKFADPWSNFPPIPSSSHCSQGDISQTSLSSPNTVDFHLPVLQIQLDRIFLARLALPWLGHGTFFHRLWHDSFSSDYYLLVILHLISVIKSDSHKPPWGPRKDKRCLLLFDAILQHWA